MEVAVEEEEEDEKEEEEEGEDEEGSAPVSARKSRELSDATSPDATNNWPFFGASVSPVRCNSIHVELVHCTAKNPPSVEVRGVEAPSFLDGAQCIGGRAIGPRNLHDYDVCPHICVRTCTPIHTSYTLYPVVYRTFGASPKLKRRLSRVMHRYLRSLSFEKAIHQWRDQIYNVV